MVILFKAQKVDLTL